MSLRHFLPALAITGVLFSCNNQTANDLKIYALKGRVKKMVQEEYGFVDSVSNAPVKRRAQSVTTIFFSEEGNMISLQNDFDQGGLIPNRRVYTFKGSRRTGWDAYYLGGNRKYGYGVINWEGDTTFSSKEYDTAGRLVGEESGVIGASGGLKQWRAKIYFDGENHILIKADYELDEEGRAKTATKRRRFPYTNIDQQLTFDYFNRDEKDNPRRLVITDKKTGSKCLNIFRYEYF